MFKLLSEYEKQGEHEEKKCQICIRHILAEQLLPSRMWDKVIAGFILIIPMLAMMRGLFISTIAQHIVFVFIVDFRLITIHASFAFAFF